MHKDLAKGSKAKVTLPPDCHINGTGPEDHLWIGRTVEIVGIVPRKKVPSIWRAAFDSDEIFYDVKIADSAPAPRIPEGFNNAAFPLAVQPKC